MRGDGYTVLLRYLAAVRRRMWLARATTAMVRGALVAAMILLVAGLAHRFLGTDPGYLLVAALLPVVGALSWAALRARPRPLDAARAADRHLGSEGLLVAALDQLAREPSGRVGGAALVLARAGARTATATLPQRESGSYRMVVPALAVAVCGMVLLLAPGAARPPPVLATGTPASTGAVSRAQEFNADRTGATSAMGGGVQHRHPAPGEGSTFRSDGARVIALESQAPRAQPGATPAVAGTPVPGDTAGPVVTDMTMGMPMNTLPGTTASTADGADAAGSGARREVAASGDGSLADDRREFRIPRSANGARVVGGGESSAVVVADASPPQWPVPAAAPSAGGAGMAVLSPRVQAYARRYLSLLAEER